MSIDPPNRCGSRIEASFSRQAGRRIIATTAGVLHHGADGATAGCALLRQTLVPVANGTHRSITDHDTARRPLP